MSTPAPLPATVPTSAPIAPAVAAAALIPSNAHRVEGLEDIQRRDLIVPDLKIGQGTTREKGVVGKLYNSLDPSETHEKMRLVAVAFKHGQVLFARDDKGLPLFDAPTPCRSDNGRTPSPDIEKPIAAACRDEAGKELCPNAKWTGNGQKPACAETHNWIVIDLDTGMPYRFSLKSTDVISSKKFLSGVNFRAKAHKRALFDFEFTLSLVQTQDQKGVYYNAVFSDIQMTKEPGIHRPFFEAFAAAAAKQEPEASGSVVDAANKVAAAERAAEGKGTTSGSPAPAPPKKSSKGRDLDFA